MAARASLPTCRNSSVGRAKAAGCSVHWSCTSHRPVHPRADLLPVTIITNSLSLLIYLPISVSGVGVYEGGAVAAFSYLGLSSERVLAAFVFQRLYMIGSSLVFLALSRVLLPTSAASHSPPATESR